jgi:hypothetical protein
VTTDKNAVQSKTLADGTVLVEGLRGAARLNRLAVGVVLYDCQGMLPASFYPPMVAVAEREVASAGRLAMFVDGWDLQSIDTGFREQWTQWFKQHKEHFHMRLLVRTKLMDMAASLANLFTGINVIKTYSSIAAWEQACQSDLPSFRRVVKESA